MPTHDSKDQDVRFSMAALGVMIGLSLWLGLDLALGAFFAGLFISTFFHHKKELYAKLYAFGFGFFAPIFFVYVGSTLPIEAILSKQVFYGAIAFILALVSFRLIASFIAFYGYLNARNTLLFALSDSMPLLFIVAIATLGKNLGVLPLNEYYSLIVATIFDAIILMVSIKLITFYWKEKYAT
jgi:Kef-type K+ transport system membrane component KefB